MTTFSLVLAGGTRAPIQGELTLGRAAGNQLRLADPAVSRRHARLVATPHGVEVHDLGSRTGTFLNGHRIGGCALAEDGVRLRLGDTRLRVERDRSEHEAARTVIVPPGRTLHVDTRGQEADTVEPGAPLPVRPRLRSGWARKRLAASEGERRVVLENLRTGRFLGLTSEEASLLDRLDGTLTVPDLVRAVSAEHGDRGVRRLLELLLELAELGMLAGSEATEAAAPTGWRRLLRPRERSFSRAPAFVAWLYRMGGKWLFSLPAYALFASIILAGTVAFAAVVARGDVRPFHVAGGLAWGSLAFVAGRLGVVALHELGHALTLTSLGRHPRRIGVKLLVVFPYAFVDTSEAWYEPRRRRIAVSMAGPITDALLAGLFALLAVATVGVARDIAFQLALGAYLGTLLNLNPLLERDGYHVLADALREPNLRRRGREYVAARIAGRPAEADASRSIRRYGVMALAWGVVTAGFAGVIVLRIAGRQTDDARLVAALAVLAVIAALVPTVLVVARPARARRRGRALEARESRSSLGGALGAGAIDAVSGHGGSSQLVRRAAYTGQVEAATASASGSLDYPGDDAPRARIAAWMGDVAARHGLPRELPVMAALVESDLRNLPDGDAHSVGYFQMQTVFWLARYPGYPGDPEIQMRWFVDQALAVKAAQPRLADDWGEWVAEIENPREDLRWKYGARLEDARALLDTEEPEPVAAGGTGRALAVAEASSAPAGALVTGGLPAARPDPSGYVERLKAEAEDIDDAQVPYQWGGGHAERQDHDDPITPLDCSGAVSRVLGIDPRVAAQFETWGEPGPGERVTIYANDGHVLMEIDGHFWGTSRSNPGGGAGWIPREQVTPGYLAGFTARHPRGA